MDPRSDVNVVRSFQRHRGATTKTLRQLDYRNLKEDLDYRHSQTKDLAHPTSDTTGERYTQALGRLNAYKESRKKRVWQDRRQADWQEENSHLQRASQELTKAIKEMLAAFSSNGIDATAPTWGKLRYGESNLPMANKRSGDGGEHHSQAIAAPVSGVGDVAGASMTVLPRSLRDLADLEAEDRKLEGARNLDLKEDGSHLREIRTLVSEFVRSCREVEPRHNPRRSDLANRAYGSLDGTGKPPSWSIGHKSHDRKVEVAESSDKAGQQGFDIRTPETTDRQYRTAEVDSRAGFVALLLVKARNAHRDAGDDLSKEAGNLEADIEASRRVLSAALQSDRAENRSSTQAWVLESIGLGEGRQSASECPQKKSGEGKCGVMGASKDRGKKAGPFMGGVEEAMMRVEVLHKLEQLDSRREARLKVLRDEFLQEAARPTSAGSVEAALDKNGGWTADQHFRFMKVVKAAKGMSTSAVSLGSLGARGGSVFHADGAEIFKKRFEVELQGVPASEISKHESWHRLRSVYAVKKKVEKEKYSRELNDLVVWGKATLEVLQKEAEQTAARDRELKEQNRRREETDSLLRSQRNVRERREWEIRQQEERERQGRLEKEAQLAEAKAIEDKRKRKALVEYHDSLRELRAREVEARESAAKSAEADRLNRMHKNKERVRFRQERSRLKREEEAKREQEAEALEVKRMQVLERLAASVPYANACVNAEAKLDHVTAASAAHFEQFEHFDRSRGHCPMFGFNTKKVLRDARFRLGLYLREAGVAGSAAAHSAVMRVVGPLPDAPF